VWMRVCVQRERERERERELINSLYVRSVFELLQILLSEERISTRTQVVSTIIFSPLTPSCPLHAQYTEQNESHVPPRLTFTNSLRSTSRTSVVFVENTRARKLGTKRNIQIQVKQRKGGREIQRFCF
jgi:hypothetical protein